MEVLLLIGALVVIFALSYTHRHNGDIWNDRDD